MKREQREIYLVLANELDSPMCTFCKYSKWEGSPCTDDAYCECQHKLDKEFDLFMGGDSKWPGDDCWGFRPAAHLNDIADVVGLILSEHFTNWSWEKTDSGTILVYGRPLQTPGQKEGVKQI